MQAFPNTPRPGNVGTGKVEADRSQDITVSGLVTLLDDGLPDAAHAGDLNWVRHPSAERLFRWAAATVGPASALAAATYVVAHALEVRRDETTPEMIIARVRRYATRWTTDASPAIRRHELSVERVWDRPESLDSAPLSSPDPLTDLPNWLAAATGLEVSDAAGERLVICASVAVNLAADDDRRGTPATTPTGGALRRRLAQQLDPPLACPVGRRSVARLLLGPTGRPLDGALNRLARQQHPEQVPLRVRASWAADALDLDPAMLGGRTRPIAREAVRRAVVRATAAPVATRPTEVEALDVLA